MEDFRSFVACYLERLKHTDPENAYHSLVEADDAVLPLLINAFRDEPNAETRSTLVEIIWQHRNPEILPFLSEALADNHPQVWKSALNGFITLGGEAAIPELESLKQRLSADRRANADRIAWINEAIEQIRHHELA